ncbi:chromosomal replication initiator protein DnaA [Lactococcus termiticola]|uniref:Chromosomal replication initiator protein DnaA n=1 Tax=Lactococcus termiticola TaxID=2169526 RepID=A0A2R5HGA5_9LACT|nr:chromosomal replication initiator protein DnaA [Lactococcus termiticola]GBG96886.1 chromosomal replication initiator protein DnaA [Lactococcus termiticola]
MPLTSEDKQFWNRVNELAKKHLKAQAYEFFIEPSQLLSVEKGVASILIVSQMHKDFWKGQTDLIRTAAFEVFGEPVSIKTYASDELSTDELEKLKTDDIQEINELEHDLQSVREKTPVAQTKVNPNKSFENFIQGDGNQLALGAAIAVSDSPGSIYNPLFIHGGSGFGKTHLMYAIGNEMLKDNPYARVMYASAENFVNDYVTAATNGKLKDFENTYRNLDLLLLDDVQFFNPEQEKTKSELFYTFNALYEKGAQIVLTSDRPPTELNNLEDRLVSRFGWGLTTDITAPDYETRMAILMKKSEHLATEIPQEVLAYIAGQIDSNVRELEGALNLVDFYAKTNKMQKVDIDAASKALRNIQNNHAQPLNNLTVKKIQDVVSKHYMVAVSDMIGIKRNKEIAFARQVAMFLIRDLMALSLPAIGGEFGGRDHTTVMHSYNKISELMNTDQQLQKDIDQIKQKLK